MYVVIIVLLLLLINLVLYIYNNSIGLIESILKIDVLIIGLASGKLLFDMVSYYKLKKRETYNDLYNIISNQVKNIKDIINNIDIDVSKYNDLVNLNYGDDYVNIVDDIYKLNEIIFILKLIEVNLDSLVIVDTDTKNKYRMYIYSIVRLGF